MQLSNISILKVKNTDYHRIILLELPKLNL